MYGIWIATWRAEAAPVVPKKEAIKIFRTIPKTRLRKIMMET